MPKKDPQKRRIEKTMPIRVKCPNCQHTQLSVIGINTVDTKTAMPIRYVSNCEKCGTPTEFLEHLIAVKKRRRTKEMIPPPLFDERDQPIQY